MPAVATKGGPLAGLIQKEMSDPARRQPLWRGPGGAGSQGGVTQGLLAKYLVCPERFRVKTIEGLAPGDRFSKVLEYGQMWHACEESLAEHGDGKWPFALAEYAKGLLAKYPFSRDDVEKWFEVCRTQFPVYIDFWRKHPDVVARKPLLQERAFDVPYKLPSGRTVRLRGKWDSVDLVGDGVWLMENKSKGEIDEEQLRKQLKFDLQTLFYITALREATRGGEIL
jgi:hypothetical protein